MADKLSLSLLTLGVIADTHIPDRAKQLHPDVLDVFTRAGVSAILHAGDIASPQVLEELSKIAPVHAVRGNRDWVLLRHLPSVRQLEFGGVKIALVHGHGKLHRYLAEKVVYQVEGYNPQRFLSRLLDAFPDSQVIVFGHFHRVFNQVIGGRLLFNPGSPHFPQLKESAPSIGLLTLHAGGVVRSEIIDLPPYSP